MLVALKPQPFDETSARDALAHEFQKLGLEFSSLHPTIRTVMERAVKATGDVRQQVERFILVARMADEQDLSNQEKRHVLEKAYERYGQNTGVLVVAPYFPDRPSEVDPMNSQGER
jgi:hypothetical protein